MQVCIFEDNEYSTLLPLVYLRPVYDLRCGILTLHEKIRRLVPGAAVIYRARPTVAGLFAEEHPGSPADRPITGDTWFINGRVLAGPALKRILASRPKSDIRYCAGPTTVAAFLKSAAAEKVRFDHAAGAPEPSQFDGIPSQPFDGTVLKYSWEFVHRTADEIRSDAGLLRLRGIRGRVYPGAHLLMKKNIVIGTGSVVKPGAVIDAEHGPVIIGRNVTIMPNVTIEGPVWIGDNSVVKAGAKIYHGTSIGPWCKVGGEIDASILHSYSNKQHDGFLGHSYLGSWVNLGADTNTSDLKNTYGSVQVNVNGEMVDSGSMFVGLTMGDHSKSGINATFDTGSVVGVSCNIYGSGIPPKFVPSFSWGSGASFIEYRLVQSLETARKVMARRDVTMSDRYASAMREVYEQTAVQRGADKRR